MDLTAQVNQRRNNGNRTKNLGDGRYVLNRNINNLSFPEAFLTLERHHRGRGIRFLSHRY
jgi:hypothetical protein